MADRCELSASELLPVNTNTLCGDSQGSGGLIYQIYVKLVNALDLAGAELIETVARMISPVEQGCHTGAYLESVKSWVDGIEPVEDTYPVLEDYVIMVWIDESRGSGSYQPDGGNLWTIDINNYRQLIGAHNTKAGVLVPGQSPSEVLPIGVGAPPEISIQTCGRGTDSRQVYINHFNRIREDVVPSGIMLAVDVSGSMKMNTIIPPYSQFVAWLRSQFPDTVITEKTFNDERWLWHINGYLDDL